MSASDSLPTGDGASQRRLFAAYVKGENDAFKGGRHGQGKCCPVFYDTDCKYREAIGTIMDAFVRTYLPFEQYDKARVTATLTAADTPRDDGYWQAFIMEIRKPKVFLIKLAIKGKSGNILRDLENFPDMPMDIIYQVVARSDYYYAKTRVTLTSEDLRTALYQYTSGVRK